MYSSITQSGIQQILMIKEAASLVAENPCGANCRVTSCQQLDWVTLTLMKYWLLTTDETEDLQDHIIVYCGWRSLELSSGFHVRTGRCWTPRDRAGCPRQCASSCSPADHFTVDGSRQPRVKKPSFFLSFMQAPMNTGSKGAEGDAAPPKSVTRSRDRGHEDEWERGGSVRKWTEVLTWYKNFLTPQSCGTDTELIKYWLEPEVVSSANMVHLRNSTSQLSDCCMPNVLIDWLHCML